MTVLRINNNIMAMNTHRMGIQTSDSLSKSIEKLSSGHRISRAGDDAAGLAISEKMRGQIRGLHQASRNAQDAISMVRTAEGGASAMHDMLQRMRQLAVQAANDTLTDADRTQVQLEVKALVTQIDTVANNTEFNTKKLLNASGASPFPGISQSELDKLTARIPGWLNDALTAIADQLDIALPDSPVSRPMDVTYYHDALDTAAASMGTADGGATLTLRVNLANVTDSNGTLISEAQLDTLIAHEVVHALQFTEMPYALTGGGAANENWFTEGLAMAIQGGNIFAVTDRNVNLVDPFDGDYRSAFEAVKVLHEITVGGISAFIDRLEAGDTLDQAFANTSQSITGTELAAATGSADFGTTAAYIAWFNNNGANGILAYLNTSADFTDGSGAIVDGELQGSSGNLTLANTILNGTGTGTLETHFGLTFTNPGTSEPELHFQIGANTGQMISLGKVNLTAAALGVKEIDMSTRSGALDSIGKTDAAISIVSRTRSTYGALQNRLEHSARNLENTAENLQASESRIRDMDMAREMMHYTKLNILAQASQAMLAQANQAPQGILQLLR